jgi:hypothetical protein
MSYYETGDGEESEGLVQGGDIDVEMGDMLDGRTPLDRTIDKIGMGACAVLCRRTERELTEFVRRQLSVDTSVVVWVR